MEKHIFLFEGNKIEPMPFFLYEVCTYFTSKGMMGLIGSKFYKSNKPLNIKKWSKSKKSGDKVITTCIDFLGAPIEFINKNNLQVYIPKKKKKK